MLNKVGFIANTFNNLIINNHTMKGKLITLALLMTASLVMNAQQKSETRSVSDNNSDKTVVDAAALNILLKSIYERLETIDSRLNDLENGVRSNGHEYVDLGLTDEQGRTIYWATCNVGADKPEDAGLYFAWGETVGYTSDTSDGRSFDWANYTWMKSDYSSWSNITKYTFADNQTSADWYLNGEFVGDSQKTLLPEDDAAHVNWGGDWRMPTNEEQDQLRTKCTWTWDSVKKGYTVKGTNGNSIFLPAAGRRLDLDLDGVGSYSYLWSSSLNMSGSFDASFLYLDSGSVDLDYRRRYFGLSVRAVCISTE